MVGRATQRKRGVSVFWKLGIVYDGAVERNSNWVGEEWAKVLVGGT